MRVALGSAFRNSSCRGQLPNYFKQASELKESLKALGHMLRLIAVEGDSVDNTQGLLRRCSEYALLPLELHVRNHGCREWGSTEEPERLAKLSYVANGIFEGVRNEDDVLVYVESDLHWQPNTIIRCINQLRSGIDVIAPLVFAGEAFYDIWGFRKNGTRFGPFHPYHGDLNHNELTTVDSAGSCLVMRAEVARTCRVRNDYALVGFCEDVWRNGFSIYADARERIFHP